MSTDSLEVNRKNDALHKFIGSFFGRELAYCYMFSIIKEIFFDGTRMDGHDDVLQYINYRTIGAIPAKEVR
jgi:hypothetical protein